MLKLSDNPVLQALRHGEGADLSQDERDERADRLRHHIDVRVRLESKAAVMRRQRRWNKTLGRRSDGAVIRPIRDGRLFDQPAMSPLDKNAMRHRLAREES